MKILNCFLSLFIITAFCSSLIAQPEDFKKNSEPGKCYAKSMMPDGHPDWTEILCPSQITNTFILELQTALKSRNYYQGELDKQYSDDVRIALKNFQIENQLPQGQLNTETVDALEIMYGKELDEKLKREKKAAKQAAKEEKRKKKIKS